MSKIVECDERSRRRHFLDVVSTSTAQYDGHAHLVVGVPPELFRQVLGALRVLKVQVELVLAQFGAVDSKSARALDMFSYVYLVVNI